MKRKIKNTTNNISKYCLYFPLLNIAFTSSQTCSINSFSINSKPVTSKLSHSRFLTLMIRKHLFVVFIFIINRIHLKNMYHYCHMNETKNKNPNDKLYHILKKIMLVHDKRKFFSTLNMDLDPFGDIPSLVGHDRRICWISVNLEQRSHF